MRKDRSMAKAKEYAMVYHNLALMLEAGVPIVKSLRTVTSGSQGKLKKAFSAVTKDVSGGTSMAEAMGKHPKVFRPIDVTVVEVGEESGGLPDSLNHLSQWYQLIARLKRIMVSGLMLPVMILHLGAFLSPVPFLIMGIVDLNGYLMKAIGTLAWLYVPAGVILGIVYFTPNTGILRRMLDYVILRIPVLRRAVRHLSLSRYCQAFHLLIKAGVPAVQCAQKATEMTGNAGIADMLKGGIESARAGRLFSEGFSDKLPLDFRESWQVGEETGDLDDVAQRLAQNTAEKAEWTFEQLAFWLPRLIYFGVLALMAIRVLQGYAAIGYSLSL